MPGKYERFKIQADFYSVHYFWQYMKFTSSESEHIKNTISFILLFNQQNFYGIIVLSYLWSILSVLYQYINMYFILSNCFCGKYHLYLTETL